MRRRSAPASARAGAPGLAGLAALAAAVMLLQAPVLPLDAAAERWSKEVARLEERLSRRDWKGTLERAVELRREMVERVDEAAGLIKPLAETLVLQALAEANLGRDEDALWHWQAAQSWLTGLEKMDLAAYGRAREVLAPQPAADAHQAVPAPASTPRPPATASPGSPGAPPGRERYQPVRVRKAVRPVYPRSLADSAMQGKVRVRLVVGVDGRPRQPAVVAAGIVPSMAFPVLDALHGWLFDPATEGRKPLAVDYQVEIRYP